jgi:hypothetical protein
MGKFYSTLGKSGHRAPHRQQPGRWKCVTHERKGKPMPWNSEDAERHTKKADDPKRQRMWAEVANSVLSDTGDEGRAIREANSAVAKDFAKSFLPSHSGK